MMRFFHRNRMSKRQFSVHVDRERCKGCELCIAVCPRKILRLHEGMNSRGQHYASVVRRRDCIGCLQCADICPDAAIEVYEEAPAHV